MSSDYQIVIFVSFCQFFTQVIASQTNSFSGQFSVFLHICTLILCRTLKWNIIRPNAQCYRVYWEVRSHEENDGLSWIITNLVGVILYQKLKEFIPDKYALKLSTFVFV